MNKDSRIYIAGGTGMVGSAIARNLKKRGFENVYAGSRADGDLQDPHCVNGIFRYDKPEYVFIAGAKVGGIYANDTYSAEFIRSNLAIQTNIIQASFNYGAKKVMFLGSSCIYPRECPQPMKEEHLMSGPLEPTNSAYAMAKLAGIEMCNAYRKQYGLNAISVMPTNLYGTNDNYHSKNSHVVPALINKIYEAKMNSEFSVDIWGDGTPKREFMHVDDCADACVYLMLNYNEKEIVNIGSGEERSIIELAQIIKNVVGYTGSFLLGDPKLNGTPRKLLDTSKLKGLGWKAQVDLITGIEKTVKEYIELGTTNRRS